MARRKKQPNKKKIRKIIITTLIMVVVSLALVGYDFYKKVYAPNISTWDGEAHYIKIPTGSSFGDVVQIMNEEGVLRNMASFEWVAERMGYKNKVKPGRYRLTGSMNNKEIVTLLRSGEQSPVNVTFHNLRTTAQLAGVVAKYIEADSLSIITLLSDGAYLDSLGFTPVTIGVIFIPDTYEFFWNTSARGFVSRMEDEYKRFWTGTRREQASKIGLSPVEVAILASIVEQETRMNPEKPTIAGVYMNRLKKGWKLEADPTLVFASGNFGMNRVLNIHKEIDSPYNTYLYEGLPPGPICLPSVASLKAVLNYQHHDYMFFCARDDFSGYHSFAVSYNQHLANARRFQRELNKRNIRS